ncbi:eukaryotic translation initiation factor 5B [Glossina fuscipes]|uniref:Eukaryotic translation initiation factor 5B n=1 Tax=Glossina fuscipes TaxID=7396 RepID=A0A8U0W8V6_9MUSC|nr:eukaryotic translation initiation factor 5B [Glossina fuscipes]
MVKTKKGKKEIVPANTGVSSGEEMENEPQETVTDSGAEEAENVKAKNKKNKQQKKSKKRNDSIAEDNEDVGGITGDVKKLNLKSKGNKNNPVQQDNMDSQSINEDESNVETDSQMRNKKKDKIFKKSAFGLLMDMDSEEDDVAQETANKLENEPDGEGLNEKSKKSSEKGIAKKSKKAMGKTDDLKTLNQNVLQNATAKNLKGGPVVPTTTSATNELESEPDDEGQNEKPKKAIEKGMAKKTKKGKRKGKGEEDDEDLDKVLAELKAECNEEAAVALTTASVVSPEDWIENEFGVEKQKKGKKQIKEKEVEVMNKDVANADVDEIEITTVKTAAEKKKEKKERQKREAALAKQKAVQETQSKQEETEAFVPLIPEDTVICQPKEAYVDPGNGGGLEDEGTKSTGKNKKKTKKDKKAEAEEENKKDMKKKGMSSAMVAAMQERLKKIKEEEERQRKVEEERVRQEEERERLRLEAVRLEAERKEKKKQKEAERKARLKAEGKLLTKRQKEDRARAQAMLEALKAQGVEIPDPTEKRPTRPGTRIRPKKKGSQASQEQSGDANSETASAAAAASAQQTSEREDTVKESWDATDTEDEANDTSQTTSTNNEDRYSNGAIATGITISNTGSNNEDSEEDDSDSENGLKSESEPELESEVEERVDAINANDPEERRLRAERRIIKRQEDAEKNRTTEDLRAAVVCVLGHVDTGKTKILDKLRRTHVQDSEAGGITQQIGATNVPIDAIKEQAKIVRGSTDFDFKLPGLLIIDTPGHESFSNLRNRGSSLCDIAILVVDIMHGLEPQTIESINLLKQKKCPFIVALNKIDRLYDWKVLARRDIRDALKEQEPNTQVEFNQRAKNVILQFAEQGLNAALFYENNDPKSYISLVPTSAITGEGMGNLLFLIIEFCQKMLAKRLMYSEELQATVLEVKAIPGLGTTIDTILINGKLREGQTMVVAGTDGPIVTQIRSLLMPQPLRELRVKNAYVEHKEIKAAQGVKIAAKDLDKAIAGINLLVAHKPDEIEICKEEVARELKSALSHIKLAQIGVYVQASTLGSLEALLEFLRGSKIPYSSIRIGPVVKRDVMKASTMLEHEPQFATILAFDVKVEREAQEMADSLGVKIFQADIIYHLFDKFMAYREELKLKKREEFRSIAVFPCKLTVLPLYIFNSRDPIVMGVMVENGIVKVGTPLCVPTKDFIDIGVVTSIEMNHKQIESARKGQAICIKIEPISGESPKMYGRHFDATDELVSKISRQSIDACKDYFRDDLIRADWALMVELKKLFQIL